LQYLALKAVIREYFDHVKRLHITGIFRRIYHQVTYSGHIPFITPE